MSLESETSMKHATFSVSFGFADFPCPEIVEASARGDIHRVQELLDEGVEVDSTDDVEGASALSWALHNGKEDVARLLLSRGASAGFASGQKRPPYSVAITTGQLDVLKTLIEHTSISSDCSFVESRTTQLAFLAAISNRDLPMVRFLIRRGVSPNAEDEIGDSALHYAIVACDESIVDELLNAGADISKLNSEGDSALRVATFRYPEKNRAIQELLTQRGASVTPPLTLRERVALGLRLL